MNRIKRLLCILLVALGGSAGAQTSLSLPQAIQTALNNNYQIQIGELEEEIATRNNSWLAAGIAPTLSGSGTTSISYTDPTNPLNPFQNFSTRNIGLGAGVEMQWTIFGGFRVYITKDRLELLEEQSAGNTTIIIENTVQAVMLAYYQALIEQEKLAVFEEVLALSRDRYQFEQTKQELGTATSFELLQFETAYLTDSTNYLLQELALETAMEQLKLLMAVDDDSQYQLSEKLEYEPVDYEYATLEQDMLNNNTNLRNQYINSEIFKKDIKLAKTNLWPKLNMRAGMSYDVNYFYTDEFPAELQGGAPGELETINNSGQTLNYYANFSLNFNLFNGGDVIRGIKNSETQALITELNIKDTKLSLKNNLSNTYNQYQTRKNITGITSLNMQAAQKNLTLAEERFETGTINSFDYRNIQLNYLNAALSNLEATKNTMDTEVELLRLTGGILNDTEQP